LNVVGLLLAAGSASRFGSDKLRHPLLHGVPIALQSLRNLQPEVDKVFAVVKPGDAALFGSESVPIVCERAHEGMGASLACAVRAAGRRDAYLVALADMPYIRRASIAAVREALERGAGLAAPYFRARRGHPVGISGRFYEQLIDLGGDEGAKKILSEHASELLKIPVGDPGVIRDIDTPADLLPPIRT
jgi:molybdenum cofactor cytidylyltransferase